MSTDKVILITGAGSGLGRELVKTFTNAGAIVVGFGRNENKLIETANLVDKSLFDYYPVDVGNFEQVQNACHQIVNKHGRIDVLFNNAAVYNKINFLDETAEQWNQAIATNINGVANCCKAVLPIMIENKTGKIFNLGSWADLAPIPNSVSYSCTKGAIHSLTKAIYQDIAHLELDIEVHEWIPGHLNTQMSDFTGMDPAIAAQWGYEILNSIQPSSKNCLFTNNHEWIPPKSLRQKLKSIVTFWQKQ